MHLQSCQHPKIIYNPYLDDMVSVPCGECDACLVNKSSALVSRLESQRLNSVYCVFFTLTYEDTYLPLLAPSWSNDNKGLIPDVLVHVKRNFKNLSNNRNHKSLSDENNDFQIPINDSILSESTTKRIMLLHAGYIPYCSVYDLQNFTKRFKSKMYRTAYGTDKGLQENQKITYFIATELGPTTLRPHCHGLFFFDDSRLAECLQYVLPQSWKFGNVKYDFVTSSASSYVASYVNSFHHLPRIYKESLRPFHLSSKNPPIGLSAVKETTIKQLFDTSSYLMSLPSPTLDGLTSVPLWRCLENRLYPQLPRNSSITLEVRHRLLQYFTNFRLSSFQEFCEDISMSVCTSQSFGYDTILYNYLFHILPFVYNCRNEFASLYTLFLSENVVRTCYYTARRVAVLCYRYRITLDDYIRHYDLYTKNKEQYKLSEQYQFQVEFCRNNPPIFLIGMDNRFFQRVRGLRLSQLDTTLYMQFVSYGLSYSDVKIIYEDEKYKTSYFRSIHYDKQLDMIDYLSKASEKIIKSRKTKKKNEYLKLHPEFANLY